MDTYLLICEGACNPRKLLDLVAVLGQESELNKKTVGSSPCAVPGFAQAVRRLHYTEHTMISTKDAKCGTCGNSRVYGNPREL
jgi:hypothetical protein